MPDWISLLATLGGGLGTLFGSDDKAQQIHPEMQKVLDQLKQRYKTGFGEEQLGLMKQGLTRRLGSEFGGLSANLRARLAQQGVGQGVQNTAQSRLNTQRLGAVGAGTAQIGIANEQAKMDALRQLAGLTGGLGFEQQGLGFAQLFGAGLGSLFNRPEEKKGLTDYERQLLNRQFQPLFG